MRQIENELDAAHKEIAVMREDIAQLFRRFEYLENLIYAMFPSASPQVQVPNETDPIRPQISKDHPRGRSSR